MLTPNDVHYGLAEMRHTERTSVLQAAYAAHPERFVRRAPTPPALPTAAWINKPINPPELVNLTDGMLSKF